MKIEERTVCRERRARVRAALSSIIEPREPGGRACGPACRIVCSACAKTDCACMCAPSCPMVPDALTSDPDYPLEPLIAPLVFEINRTGVFKPCWSCEGHDSADGRLWKVPRVWFYADSIVHVRVLAEAMSALSAEGATHVSWRVAVTHAAADNPDTIFSLEPDTSGKGEARLNDLQRDAGAIAEHLERVVMSESRRIHSMI